MTKKACFAIILVVLAIGATAAKEPNSEVTIRINESIDSLLSQIQWLEEAPRIGVAMFRPNSPEVEERRLHEAVTEIVEGRFLAHEGLIVVENRNLDEILKTHELHLTGFVNETTAASIGQLVGVRYLCLGGVSAIGGVYRIDVRIVDVESGVTIASTSLDLARELLDDRGYNAVSRRYRIALGPTIGLDNDKTNGRFQPIGAYAGYLYRIHGNHWINIHAKYYFVGGMDNSGEDEITFGPELQFAAGYQFVLPLSHRVHCRLGANWGYVTYVMNPRGYAEDFRAHAVYAEPTIDLVFMPNKPLSMFLAFGARLPLHANNISYYYALPPPSQREFEAYMWNFNIGSGIQFFF